MTTVHRSDTTTTHAPVDAGGVAVTGSAPEIFVPRRSRRPSVVTPPTEPLTEATTSVEPGRGESSFEDLASAGQPFSVPRLSVPWADPVASEPKLREQYPTPTTIVVPTGEVPAVQPGAARQTAATTSTPVPVPGETAAFAPPIGSAATAVPDVAEHAAPGAFTPTVLVPARPVGFQQAAQPQPVVAHQFAPLALAMPSKPLTKAQKKRAKKQQRGGGFGRFLAFVVVAALAGGAAFVARDRYFGPTWDEQARPFADTVEAARGTTIRQPVQLDELDGPAFAALVYDVILDGQDPAVLAGAARAMGLLSGDFDSLGTAGALARGRLALYDAARRRVAVDATVGDGPSRQAAVLREMDIAVADQRLGWGDGWDQLSPAARLARRGEVEGAAVLLSEEWLQGDALTTVPRPRVLPPVELPPTEGRGGVPDDVLLDGLLARTVGAWAVSVKGEVAEGERAPSAEDASLWNPLAPSRLLPAPAEGADPAAVASPTVTRGMGYWFLVLATRLEPEQAWDAARAWTGDQQEVRVRNGQVCVTSTIATADDAGTFVLGSALYEWAARGPAEAGATVDLSGPRAVVVESCDPGPQVANRSRVSGPAELGSLAVASWFFADPLAGGADPVCTVGAATSSGAVSALARELRDTPASSRVSVLASERWSLERSGLAAGCAGGS